LSGQAEQASAVARRVTEAVRQRLRAGKVPPLEAEAATPSDSWN